MHRELLDWHQLPDIYSIAKDEEAIGGHLKYTEAVEQLLQAGHLKKKESRHETKLPPSPITADVDMTADGDKQAQAAVDPPGDSPDPLSCTNCWAATPPITCIHMITEMIIRWRIVKNEACCPWHEAVRHLSKICRKLTAGPCFPDFLVGRESHWQCPKCLAVDCASPEERAGFTCDICEMLKVDSSSLHPPHPDSPPAAGEQAAIAMMRKLVLSL